MPSFYEDCPMKRILYVEDDEDTAETVRTILELGGHSVTLARDGREGIRHLDENQYDLALLDILLPDVSGWEVFENVKNEKTKVVFLTCLPISRSEREDLCKRGVADYLIKPFIKEALATRINEILSQ